MTALRAQYAEYLADVVGGSPPKKPRKSYTDWAGLRVLSFADWKRMKRKNVTGTNAPEQTTPARQ